MGGGFEMEKKEIRAWNKSQQGIRGDGGYMCNGFAREEKEREVPTRRCDKRPYMPEEIAD